MHVGQPAGDGGAVHDAVTVSNLDESQYTVLEIGNYFGTVQQRAQAFTTGSASGGYTLSSIDIRDEAAVRQRLGDRG